MKERASAPGGCSAEADHSPTPTGSGTPGGRDEAGPDGADDETLSAKSESEWGDAGVKSGRVVVVEHAREQLDCQQQRHRRPSRDNTTDRVRRGRTLRPWPRRLVDEHAARRNSRAGLCHPSSGRRAPLPPHLETDDLVAETARLTARRAAGFRRWLACRILQVPGGHLLCVPLHSDPDAFQPLARVWDWLLHRGGSTPPDELHVPGVSSCVPRAGRRFVLSVAGACLGFARGGARRQLAMAAQAGAARVIGLAL